MRAPKAHESEAKLRISAQSGNKLHDQFQVLQRRIAKSVPQPDSPGEEIRVL